MAQRPSSLMLLLLLGGSALVVLLAFQFRPRERAAGRAPAGINTAAPASAPTAASRFNRVRRPGMATVAAPEPGTTELAAALAILRDERATLPARRQAAFDLVRIGSGEAMEALQSSLPELPPLVKSAIAEALSSSKHPRAAALLLGMWVQADETTARAIATALGHQGCADCLAALRVALLDPSQPIQRRGDAAAGLGVSSDTDALKLLEQVFAAAKGTDLAGGILSAISQRPFTEVRDFMQQVLDAPSGDPELRLAALESLNNLPAEATGFLTKYLFDPDADIRSEAAWALSTTETPGNAGPQLLGLLVHEENAEVRLRYFQALANQEGFDVNGALHIAQAEPDASARLAAYAALAGIEESSATSELRAFLDQTAVPALFNTALQGGDLPQRLQAVMILQQTDSSASQQALQSLRQRSTDEVVQRALRGVN